MQELIADLELDLHPGANFEATTRALWGDEVYERVAAEFAGAVHPLVRIHPVTGRPALFLCGAYIRGIVGMHPAESDALLTFLRTRLDDPNLQCRWRWQQGDVAVWDERCTNHRALSDHYPAPRLVRRCTVGRACRVDAPRCEWCVRRLLDAVAAVDDHRGPSTNEASSEHSHSTGRDLLRRGDAPDGVQVAHLLLGRGSPPIQSRPSSRAVPGQTALMRRPVVAF
jgi:hypothetical protein